MFQFYTLKPRRVFGVEIVMKPILYQEYISLPGMKGHKLQESSGKQFQSNMFPTEKIL